MKRYTYFLYILSIATGVVSAQTTSPPPSIVQQYTFAPVGILAGQTLRLNLANVAGGNAVCMANLSFINSDGTSIKNENVTVNAGVTMSYPLVPSDISGNPASAEVRGFVKIDRQVGPPVAGPGTPQINLCSAVMSLELADSSGTHLVLTNPTAVSGIAIPVLASVPPSAQP